MATAFNSNDQHIVDITAKSHLSSSSCKIPNFRARSQHAPNNSPTET